MKKSITRTLAAIMVLCLVLAGCGASGETQAAPAGSTSTTTNTTTETVPTTSVPAPVKKTSYAIGSSGSTGAQYIISAAMANEINKTSDRISIDVQATNGGSENMQLCESGENGFGVVNVGSMWCYYNGAGWNKPEDKTENVLGVMALQASCGQLVVSKRSGIQSWEDLRGKRVCLGTSTASVHSISEAILKHYGIDYQTDLASYELLSQSEMCEKLSDGDLDAIFMTAAVPTAAIMNLFATPDEYMLIDADPAVLQEVIDGEYPFLSIQAIPAGTYNGVDYEVHVLYDRSGIVCNKDLPEEDVYEFCKQVYENWDVIKEGHATLPAIDVTTLDNVSIPLHPGAERFYAEIGILG